jgi:hypothetical protein
MGAEPDHPAPRALPGDRLTKAGRWPGRCCEGIGILIPVKQPTSGGELDVNTRTRNAIQRSLRCLGERGFALLTGRWRTL